jgi:hypothetical protein
MYTLVYKDAEFESHMWIFRTEELALEMKRRIAVRWYHAWAELDEETDPEEFIHTEEFHEALEDWYQFSNHEESFTIGRPSIVNCKTALESLDIPG